MSIVLPAVDDQATLWFRQLYEHADEGWLSHFSIDRRDGSQHVRWHRVEDIESGAATVRQLAQHGDVWHGAAIRTHRTSGRGTAAECGWLPGLWADIDWQDPGHQDNDALPVDQEAAVALVRSFPIAPTAVIRSGGGLQPWWLFDEIVAVDEITGGVQVTIRDAQFKTITRQATNPPMVSSSSSRTKS